MDCGCGGSTYGGALNAEHQPTEADGYYWTGTPAESPASESDKAEKAPAKPKAAAK